jgi:hypothetical protein
MAADPDCITVRRDCMLAAIAQRCPALLPVVAWAYGQHSRLLVQHSEEVVRSQSGVRQGDTLGPLLFALTLQVPLEQVAEMGLASPVTYADDTFLQGARAPTMSTFHALTALAAPLGLRAQPVKCVVYSEDSRRRICGRRARHAPRAGWPSRRGHPCRHYSLRSGQRSYMR